MTSVSHSSTILTFPISFSTDWNQPSNETSAGHLLNRLWNNSSTELLQDEDGPMSLRQISYINGEKIFLPSTVPEQLISQPCSMYPYLKEVVHNKEAPSIITNQVSLKELWSNLKIEIRDDDNGYPVVKQYFIIGDFRVDIPSIFEGKLDGGSEVLVVYLQDLLLLNGYQDHVVYYQANRFFICPYDQFVKLMDRPIDEYRIEYYMSGDACIIHPDVEFSWATLSSKVATQLSIETGNPEDFSKNSSAYRSVYGL